MASFVMGPEGEMKSANVQFSDKIPPCFNGRDNYASYREDVIMWTKLTSLAANKQGPALVGSLSGEAKASVMSIPVDKICNEAGVTRLLAQLDKSYAVNPSNRLNADLSKFLDFTWDKTMTVEQFIAGFHSRLDRLATLRIDDTLKGHILLRQSLLLPHDQNILIGAASGSFNVNDITAAMRTTFMHHPPIDSTMMTSQSVNMRESIECDNNSRTANSKPDTQHPSYVSSRLTRPTFYSYKTSSDEPENIGVVLDTGACGSVVGQTTLDRMLSSLGLNSVPNAPMSRQHHRFGTNTEAHNTICAVKMPFQCMDAEEKNPFKYDVVFDVIEGDLPFLLGLPSLLAMKANLNFDRRFLGLRLSGSYVRIQLLNQDGHLFLPFQGKIREDKRSPRSNTASHYSVMPSSSMPKTYASYCPGTYTTSRSYTSNHSDSQSHQTKSPNSLGHKELKKLHLQLKHATVTQLTQHLKSARLWNPSLSKMVSDVVCSCQCQLAFPPEPHSVVGPSPPSEEVQTHLALDVVSFAGEKFLHVIDRTTGWSEVGHIHRRDLIEQVRVFSRIQLYRHGLPRTILADGEFSKGAFLSFCDDHNIVLTITAAHAHEANGAIERANRTLRSYFDRLRVNNLRASVTDLVAEATYGKNINRGSKLASSFELLYRRSPLLSTVTPSSKDPIPTMSKHNEHLSRKKIKLMLRSKTRASVSVRRGDSVYIWRDDSGWIGPADVIETTTYGVEVLHNGHRKTASHNRVRRIGPSKSDDIVASSSRPLTSSANQPPFPLDAYESDDEQEDDVEESTLANTETIEASNADIPEIDISEDPAITLPIMKPRSGNRISAHELSEVTKEGDAFSSRKEQLDTDTDNQRRSSARLASRSTNLMTHSNTDMYTPHRLGHEYVKQNSPDVSYGSTRDCSYTSSSPATDEEKLAAFAKELKNWTSRNAFELIQKASLPKRSNVVGSHTIFRRKDDGSLKARIVPWGDHDDEKDYLRCDSPCLNPEIFRLVLSIAAEFGWMIAQMDISAAFLQAKGFTRSVFVKPPKEACDDKHYWKLNAAAYGLADSGRLWYRTSDHALVHEFDLIRSKYEPTLYYKREDDELAFILATQVDNYIYTGLQDNIISFEKFLHDQFDVGALDHECFTALGCEIKRSDDGSIIVTQRTKIDNIDLIVLNDKTGQSKLPDRPANASEKFLFRSTIGKMLYIGRMCNPIMLSHASSMARKMPDLHVRHLKDLNALLKFDKKTVPMLKFGKSVEVGRYTLEAMSDASMSSSNEGGARGAFVIFRRKGDLVHPLYWSARKLRRVARSSSTAELLAASDAASVASYLQHLLAEVLYKHASCLTFDSRSLLNLATTIREPTETLNKIDLSFLRQLFNPSEINTMAWGPGYNNVADSMTKDNRCTAALLLKVFREGLYPRHAETIVKTAESPLMDTLVDNEDEAQDG